MDFSGVDVAHLTFGEVTCEDYADLMFVTECYGCWCCGGCWMMLMLEDASSQTVAKIWAFE